MNLEYSNFLSILKDGLKINIDQTKVCSQEEYSFITHAHSDHVCNTPQKTFATKETIDLLNGRLIKNKFDFKPIKFNKEVYLTDNLKVTALNAGHILGSSMFYFEDKNTTLLYTGDLNTKPSLLLKGAKPINADILVIDSTFGREGFSFPLRSLVYDSFLEKLKKDIFENKFIIIAGYTLGKNQEIISFLNKYLKIKPLVDKETYKYSTIYNQNGHSLEFTLLDHNIYSSNVLVMPLSLINRNFIKSLEHQLLRKVSSYVLTGWNFSRGSNLLNISDHTDFESTLDFVDQVNPKKVYTIHGFTKNLATSIETKLGIYARPVSFLKNKGL